MDPIPRNILVVDDHADSAAMLAKLLRMMGHFVKTADSCQTARDVFERDHAIDMLLLDLGLPDGDGCDLLHDLATMRKVPAVAVTGYGMASDIERSKAAGFVAHITKPLIVTQLREVLSDLQRGSLLPPSSADTFAGGRAI